MKMGTRMGKAKKGFFLATAFLGCLLFSSISFAGTMVDLTTAGSSGFINGALFVQIDPSSTGTGVIDSFLRMQTSNAVEQGYNTDGTPLPFNDLGGNFTRSLLLTEVPIVNIGGIAYRQFLLDINQTGTNPLLSLDKIQIYLGTTGNVTGTTLSALGTLVYDLDAGAVPSDSNWIKLNYNLNTGSGSGDMFAYIPNSVFTGSNPYVYLYSQFGAWNSSEFANNDGFEEWAVLKGATTPVPEPGTMLLLGSGLVGLAGWGRKKFRK